MNTNTTFTPSPAARKVKELIDSTFSPDTKPSLNPFTDVAIKMIAATYNIGEEDLRLLVQLGYLDGAQHILVGIKNIYAADTQLSA